MSPVELGPEDPLVLELDRPVDAWAGPTGLLGLPDHAASTTEVPERFVLRPVTRWPIGRLEVGLGPGWFDLEGRPLESRTGTVAVTVLGAPPRPPVELRAPLSPLAPRNLRWLVVHAPDATSFRHRWGAAQVAAQSGPERRIAVPPQAADSFALSVDGSTLAVDLGAEPDLEPPELGPPSLAWSGAGVELSFEVDEPVWVEARLDGRALPVARPLVHTGRLLLTVPVEGPGLLEGQVADLSGNEVRLGPIELVPGPRIQVELTEILATPLRDWGDSEPAGLPFDGSPGHGSVTPSDEWVELVNRGEALDLSAVRFELHTVDGTPAVTVLPGAPGAYFGSGGSWTRWRPGEALVVRPRGAMSSQELTISIRSGTATLDEVRVGESGVHPGGSPPDAVHEALAKTERGWRWCRPTPGDPRPPLECARAGP